MSHSAWRESQIFNRADGKSIEAEPTGPGRGQWEGEGVLGLLRRLLASEGESRVGKECCNSSHFISVHCGQTEQKLQTTEGRNRA